jgi:hypothetical protein
MRTSTTTSVQLGIAAELQRWGPATAHHNVTQRPPMLVRSGHPARRKPARLRPTSTRGCAHTRQHQHVLQKNDGGEANSDHTSSAPSGRRYISCWPGFTGPRRRHTRQRLRATQGRAERTDRPAGRVVRSGLIPPQAITQSNFGRRPANIGDDLLHLSGMTGSAAPRRPPKAAQRKCVFVLRCHPAEAHLHRPIAAVVELPASPVQ